MTKYFVDETGSYIGGFDGAEPPEGAIEVPGAPEDARQTWQGQAWSAVPSERQMVAKSLVQARIIEAGKMGDAKAMLDANPVYFARWFAPDHPAVYCDDEDAMGLVLTLGLDPADILKP